MSRVSKKSALVKHLDVIDMNTRAIAKLVSALEYLRDDDTITIAHQERIAKLIEPLMFALIQERRNLRAWFEDELKKKWRQQ